MIQVRKIREFLPKGEQNPRKFDAPLDPDVVIDNMRELIQRSKEIVEKLPAAERKNLYYTLGHLAAEGAEERKKRTWAKQDVIGFDIDNIEYIDDRPNPKYIPAIFSALNIDKSKCAIVASGNGLQILIKPKFEITDVKFFEKNKKYYQAICFKLNSALQSSGLKGESDISAFAPNRLFRLPYSINEKPNKPKRQADLINANLEEQEIDLAVMSGLPVVADDDALTEKELTYFKIDKESVLSGCEFLQFCKREPNNVSEPQWYAMLTVTSRLDATQKLSHEYSKGHSSYSEHDTNNKIEYALKAGPRTCDNIETMFEGCKTCKNYKRVRSPISIRSEKFIATAETGFHLLHKSKLIPQIDDLRKFYFQEEPYINSKKRHFKWCGSHWKLKDDITIAGYAREHFFPSIKNDTVSQFMGAVLETELRDMEFFTETTNRKLNLKNGIYDLDKKTLTPHSTEFGFRSVLDFEYNPDAVCPRFDKMLEDITCGDKNRAAVLMEFMGYAFSNDECKSDKFLLLTGTGSNGKSRFLEIFRHIAKQQCTALSASDLRNKFARTMLDGSLFNITEEMPQFTDKVFWEDIKSLSAGGSLLADVKNKEAYTLHNKCKFIMTCNILPQGTSPSDGFLRRFIIVPFEAVFSAENGNVDVNLVDYIVANELPGVFNRILEGYARLRANEYNFTKSEAIEEQLKGYRKHIDSAHEFFEENIEVGEPESCVGMPEYFIIPKGPNRNDEKPVLVLSMIYAAYRNQMEKDGEKPVSLKEFKRRIFKVHKFSSTSKYDLRRTKVANSYEYVVRGVRWKQ